MSKHVDLGLTCLCVLYGPFFYFKTCLFSMQRQKSVVTDVSKIDENHIKQTLASLPCFGAYR